MPDNKTPIFTPKRKERFLELLKKHKGLYTRALAAMNVQISRTTLYNEFDRDPVFKERARHIFELGTEDLEAELVRRAVQGVEEPVFYQGEECGRIRKYSDTNLQFALRSRAPDRYRDHASIEHTGKDGGPIQHDLSKLSESQLDALEQLIDTITPDAS